MNNEVSLRHATVRSLISNNKRQVRIDDKNLNPKIGDIVICQRNKDNSFGSFDFGMVVNLYEKFDNSLDQIYITEVISESAEVFKEITKAYRKKEIEKEISKRIKEVDKDQRIKVYAEMDETIASLYEEMKGLQD